MSVAVRDLAPEDAPALVDCVRRCYGETYPEALFYDAEAVARALHDERLISKAAVDEDGTVIGHLASRRAFAGDLVAEAVGGIVDPAHRGRHWLRRLGAAMFAAHRERGLVGVHLYATSAHLRTQTMIVAGGGTPTGVLLAHIPGGTRYEGIDHDFGDRRIAAVVFYQPLAPMPPLEVYPSPADREGLASLYAAMEMPREYCEPDPSRRPLGASLRLDSGQGLATLTFGGEDADTDLDSLLDLEPVARAEGIHADVPLASPHAAATASALRDRGFVYGALLPGDHRSERLRLQRVSVSRVAPDRAQTGSPAAAALLHQIVAEMANGPF